MTMQCWPDDDRDERAWDAALRRRLRRVVRLGGRVGNLAPGSWIPY